MATRNDHIRRQRSSGTLQGSGTAIAGANKATWSSQEAAPPPHSTFGLHMSAMCTYKCASIKSSSVDRMNVDFLLWKKCGYLMTGVLILYPALRRVERGFFSETLKQCVAHYGIADVPARGVLNVVGTLQEKLLHSHLPSGTISRQRRSLS